MQSRTPGLEASPSGKPHRAGEERQPGSRSAANYDWVDEKEGTVRIPIDAAMKALVDGPRHSVGKPTGGAEWMRAPEGI